MALYEQARGISGMEKVPFDRKKPPATPGSGRGGYLLLRPFTAIFEWINYGIIMIAL